MGLTHVNARHGRRAASATIAPRTASQFFCVGLEIICHARSDALFDRILTDVCTHYVFARSGICSCAVSIKG